MGGFVIHTIRNAVWATILFVLIGQSPIIAQTSNLAYQVASMSEDVRLLEEAIKSMRVELDAMRRENDRLRRQLGGYDSKIDNSKDGLATVTQLNKAVESLEERDIKMKNEIVLQVTEQITDFADSVNKSIGGLPAPPPKPDPDVLTEFHDNYPKTGTPYVVRSGDTISGIASKFGSTRDWIQNANRISHPKYLQVGRSLFIPHE